MKKRAAVLLMVPVFGLFLTGCDAAGVKKGVKDVLRPVKHWLDDFFSDVEPKTSSGISYRLTYHK